jgi:phosphoribosyl-ATP pyrophosphohydrolase/phosphoribosyl-AMP cyclohydrolase
VLDELEGVLRGRLEDRPAGSYSVRLLDDLELVQRKVIEEAFELCLEIGRSGRDDFAPDRVASEAADLVYHVLAGLVAVGVPLGDVLDELARRRGRAGAREAEEEE